MNTVDYNFMFSDLLLLWSQDSILSIVTRR